MATHTPACMEDWTNLTSGLAGLIAEHLLASDVADYVRFRAVCTAWRACSDDPRAQSVFDRRFHPRRWIMTRRSFRWQHLLNVDTGERIDLPHLDGRHYLVLGPTAEGLLVLCRRGYHLMQLLNPLTGQLIDLPRADTVVDLVVARHLSPYFHLDDLTLVSAGLAEDSMMIALLLQHPKDGLNCLVVARPSGKYWIPVHTNNRIVSALSFAGRFYCATPGKVVMLQATMAGQQPQLVLAAADYGFHTSPDSSVCLVDDNGGLSLTRWFLDYTGQRTGACKVYRVDLDAGKTVVVPRVDRERAVFISPYCDRALSVRAGLSPFITGNAIYFCTHQIGISGLNFHVCRVMDGSITEDCRMKPGCSIVDHLARYILGYW